MKTSPQESPDRNRATLARSGCWACLLALFLLAPPSASGQTAPQLVSVSPADGASDVPTDSKIVFTFDQALGPAVVPIPSFPPFLIGSFEITPSTVIVSAALSRDGTVLTLTASAPLPENTAISWKLNPPGSGAFTLANASGQALAAVSGGFRTKSNATGSVPRLVSSSPADGAAGIPANSPVVFVFDQEMDTSVPLTPTFLASSPGNYDFKPQGNFVTGGWGDDKRTLTFAPSGFFLPNTEITWTLNPSGAASPIKSAGGQPLPAISGRFKTLKNGLGPASTNELCNIGSVPPSTNGSYSLFKRLQYSQTAQDDLMPAAEERIPFLFSAFVQGPAGGASVTNATIVLPNGERKTVTNLFGSLNFIDPQPTEAALDSAYPPGSYEFRFQQTGLPERNATMSLPPTLPAIPRIANIAEAQNIDAAAPFTLRWLPFAGAGPNANIHLTIFDELGNLVFLAPNFCIPRDLTPSDVSTVIPANYFLPGVKYEGTLTFGSTFFIDTNSIPGMTGFGNLSRTTTFPLATSGQGGGTLPPPAAAARFTAFRLLPNGRPELTLTGTPSRAYTIQRKGNLAATIWAAAGAVTMNADGTAIFEDASAGLQWPAFYRARSD